MATCFVRSSPDRVVLVRALAGDRRVVFLGKTPTLFSQCLSPHWRVDTGEFNAMVTLPWTSMPSSGEWKYSQSLHGTETGISAGLMDHLTRMQTLPLPLQKPVQPGECEESYCIIVLCFRLVYEDF